MPREEAGPGKVGDAGSVEGGGLVGRTFSEHTAGPLGD